MLLTPEINCQRGATVKGSKRLIESLIARYATGCEPGVPGPAWIHPAIKLINDISQDGNF
jgi:hypothetical protein